MAAADVQLSTTPNIAGCVAVLHCGLVFASEAFTNAQQDANPDDPYRSAFETCLKHLRVDAASLGANAVVGIRVERMDRDSEAARAEPQLIVIGTAIVAVEAPTAAPVTRGGLGFGVGVGFPLDFG